jgi:riboflavin biosynthesis pyrimidine reductase
MDPLSPLETLLPATEGVDLPLPPELLRLYGRLRFPQSSGRPRVVANFVSTIDGVASLAVPGLAGGGPISGSNRHDRMVMGLLRSAADAVIVGAGTLASVPNHLWTADYIFPALSDPYRRFRQALGKEGHPLAVIVTGRGEVDTDLPVFRSAPEVETLVVTTRGGARRLRSRDLPPSVAVTEVEGEGPIAAREILSAAASRRPLERVLVEGGPRLMGDFFHEGALDELFLTVSPQVAGRDDAYDRPGIVAGRRFAPEAPLWGTLSDVRRGASFLFLRYVFEGGRPLPGKGGGP